MPNVVKMKLEELEKIEKTTTQAGDNLRQVHKNLQSKYTGLVPDQWEGEAARAFVKDMDVVMSALDKLASVVEGTPAVMERMVKRLAEGHAQSAKHIQQAGQDYGSGGGGTSAP